MHFYLTFVNAGNIVDQVLKFVFHTDFFFSNRILLNAFSAYDKDSFIFV